jgi:hypothetical protein
MPYVRDYQQEEKTAKARGEQSTGHNSGSAVRHRARRLMLKLGMVKKGQDVDHKDPIVKGGPNNALSNLRARSVHANRSYPRTANAGMK